MKADRLNGKLAGELHANLSQTNNLGHYYDCGRSSENPNLIHKAAVSALASTGNLKGLALSCTQRAR